jgi:hypothetical protein
MLTTFDGATMGLSPSALAKGYDLAIEVYFNMRRDLESSALLSFFLLRIKDL